MWNQKKKEKRKAEREERRRVNINLESTQMKIVLYLKNSQESEGCCFI